MSALSRLRRATGASGSSGPGAVAQAAEPTPVPGGHAHNDYLHLRPLADALDHGMTSVEADVWLVDGRLLLGHRSPRPDRTLEEVYLAPLEERVRTHGGSAHADWPGTLQLLVDLKTDAASTWPALERALAAHPTLITRWEDGVRVPAPVEVVVSGSRDLAQIAAAPVRWSACDGTLADLGRGISPELVPMVSADWGATFSWRGRGAMPADERRRLESYADQARAQGCTLRFYGAPDPYDPWGRARRTRVWDAQRAAGVTWLGSDHLRALETYLRAHPLG